jgi:inward rectifier potassium channel
LSETNEHSNNFFNAFFFSVQTLTSVGYGQISPIGMGANIVATIESFIGLMSIALITGLLYGRFSKPTSKIKYSQNIIITPLAERKALMFKMVNQRNAVLLNTRVKIILNLDKGIGQGAFNKEFHQLELQVDQVNFFPLTWTIVHEITEDSPMNNLSLDELKKRNAEVFVFVEAFDETHNQNIVEKRSYAGDQFIEDVKFDKNFKINSDGMIELHIEDLDNMLPIED